MSEQVLHRFIDIQHYLIGLTILKSKVFYLPNILKYTVINTTNTEVFRFLVMMKSYAQKSIYKFTYFYIKVLEHLIALKLRHSIS